MLKQIAILLLLALLGVSPARAESSACPPTIEGGTLLVRTCHMVTHVERTIDLGNLPNLLSTTSLEWHLPRLASLASGESFSVTTNTVLLSLFPPTREVHVIHITRTGEALVGTSDTLVENDAPSLVLVSMTALIALLSTMLSMHRKRAHVSPAVSSIVASVLGTLLIDRLFDDASLGVIISLPVAMLAALHADVYAKRGTDDKHRSPSLVGLTGGMAGGTAGVLTGALVEFNGINTGAITEWLLFCCGLIAVVYVCIWGYRTWNPTTTT